MTTLASIVDWDALGQTALAALLAGVGVAFSFSIAILGAAKLSDPSRDPGLAATAGYGFLTVAGVLATVAAIAFGLVVMTG